jgi:hypothetical protein
MFGKLLALQSDFSFSASGEISPVIWIVYIALIVLIVASLWRIFTKAGRPGWAAIIPIYNLIVLLDVAGKPWWWILLLFIPLVNFIVIIVVYMDLAKAFGQGTGFGCLLILFSFIMLPLLAFGPYEYQGT